MASDPNYQQQVPLPGTSQQQQVPSMAKISAKEFGAKFKSKRECYNFLAVECDIYLPPYGKSHTLSSLTVSLAQTTRPCTS